MPSAAEVPSDYHWVRAHGWSNYHELRRGFKVVASLQVHGSTGTAELGNRRYQLTRSRWPAFITLSAAETNDLRARLLLLPLPPRVDFDDGESFRLGWVNFWKKKWSWTRENGKTVLLTNQSGTILGLDACSPEKLVLLAILQRSMAALAIPWF